MRSKAIGPIRCRQSPCPTVKILSQSELQREVRWGRRRTWSGRATVVGPVSALASIWCAPVAPAMSSDFHWSEVYTTDTSDEWHSSCCKEFFMSGYLEFEVIRTPDVLYRSHARGPGSGSNCYDSPETHRPFSSTGRGIFTDQTSTQCRRQPTAGCNFEKYFLFHEHLANECPGTRRLAPSLDEMGRKVQRTAPSKRSIEFSPREFSHSGSGC